MAPITVLSQLQFTEAQLAKLRAVSPSLEIHQFTNTRFDDLPEALRRRVEILYSWGRTANEAHRYPNLKWLQTHSAGIDNLLTTPVWRSDITITSMNGVHAVTISEYALALMLAFNYKIPTMVHFQDKAEWPQGRWDIFARPELRGSTLGIVGYGAIGRELGRQAQALGMRVLAANRSGQRWALSNYSMPDLGDEQAVIPEKIYPTDQLADMLPECDYVVLLAPLTPETRHLFNAKLFAGMKPSAIFINLARGGLVDEPALINALQQNQIGGAGLDVFEEEPLPPDSPLWKFKNIIISPHISGFSFKYDDRANDIFAENLRRYVNNQPLLNLVERERGY